MCRGKGARANERCQLPRCRSSGLVCVRTIDRIEESERLSRQLQDKQDIYEELTGREIGVLRLLAMGLSNKQIAERLVLSPNTVSGYTQSIFGKLALNSCSAATRYAVEHHLT